MIEAPASQICFWNDFPPLRFDSARQCLVILDQTALPFRVRFRKLARLEQFCEAISTMQVRGAPLIGMTAAFGLALALKKDPGDSALLEAAESLLSTRPTAVNLRWALERLCDKVAASSESARHDAAIRCAITLQSEEAQRCDSIGRHGFSIIERVRALRCAGGRPLRILTHCNAGALATGAWGTATAPLFRAALEGMPLQVWVDETRPRNQGGRLTSWELQRAGIDFSLISDNSAGTLMQRGEVDLCVVGSDRVSARGDVCNKIGTYPLALAAWDNGIPFYAALPSSTVDWHTDAITDSDIEEREGDELLEIDGFDKSGSRRRVRIAPPGIRARNIAFDVTPARLISGGILCEHGLFAAGRAGMNRLRNVCRGEPDDG